MSAATQHIPAGDRPLTGPQRSLLATIALRAFRRLGRGLGDMTFDDYRHEVSVALVGCRISEALKKHFDTLFLRFKADAGEIDGAWRKAMDKLSNEQRSMIHRIRRKLDKADLPDSYAVKIACDKFGYVPGWSRESMEGLTLDQLEKLSFDVDRAVRALMAKEKKGAVNA